MRLLAIETSCDETAVALLDCEGDENGASFTLRSQALLSQIEIHAKYGGVFPALAKREHAKNLVPLLQTALEEASLPFDRPSSLTQVLEEQLRELFSHEPELFESLKEKVCSARIPEIDAIAVTKGPGLAPALWVGVNFARALSLFWNKPLVGVNHMEGHALSALLVQEGERFRLPKMQLPLLALLISGGHTELVLKREWQGPYELIGRTRDDAVGEAFDKVARMLGLPYPGGPEISKLAERARVKGIASSFPLPRPMVDDPSFDFSFSGLKTAVLYLLKVRGDLEEHEREALALSFENTVASVLFKKTSDALFHTGAKTLVLGGGVSANIHIRRVFEKKMHEEHPEVALSLPEAAFTTDNAVMIGVAGYMRALQGTFDNPETLQADGNLALSTA